MARPKRVFPKSLPQYDKLHTRKVKMFSGVELTALHCIKETEKFFFSISSWCFCVNSFKHSKKDFNLEFNIPVVTDEQVKSFLNTHAWSDWVERQKEDSDMKETLEFLRRVFPDKEYVYFHELKCLVGAFCHGSFIEYDKDGDIETPSEHDIKQRKYYTQKYRGKITDNDVEYPQVLKDASTRWTSCKDDNEKRSRLLTEFLDLERDWYYKNHDLTEVFVKVGQNTVVAPYIFTHCCVAGSAYENAGDIYMVVTEDKVYFETERHF